MIHAPTIRPLAAQKRDHPAAERTRGARRKLTAQTGDFGGRSWIEGRRVKRHRLLNSILFCLTIKISENTVLEEGRGRV